VLTTNCANEEQNYKTEGNKHAFDSDSMQKVVTLAGKTSKPVRCHCSGEKIDEPRRRKLSRKEDGDVCLIEMESNVGTV
jgi:hypothetical protein